MQDETTWHIIIVWFGGCCSSIVVLTPYLINKILIFNAMEAKLKRTLRELVITSLFEEDPPCQG